MSSQISHWLITNAEGDYWSNAMGWVDRDSADRFTAAETGTLRLPIGDGVVWQMES